MNDTRWWKYVERLLGDDTFKAAATKAGFNQSAFSRWSRGAAADPAFVVKLARAYGTNVLEALVEAEFLTEDEAQLTEVEPRLDLKQVDGALLAEELDRRIKTLNYLNNLDANPEHPDIELGPTVVDLANIRKKSNDRGEADTPTVETFTYDADRMVAYSGPDEDKLREIEKHGENYDWTDPNQIP